MSKTGYLLRNVPTEAITVLKHAAIERNTTLQNMLIEAIEEAAKKIKENAK